jgi:hypothetical protein
MITKECNFDIGDKLKEKITGFEGVVMSIAFYSTGCIHYGLLTQKTKKDGTLPDWQYFDESRLSMVQQGEIDFEVKKEKPSGPGNEVPQIS